ncbi:uncharacterized protein LOC116198899 [Punica granatum]|uniref:Uncharacterized protein n=2 Tax=Punica granatum TaxID=22663 RepID=A0A2I0LDY3_PUNGR|nr:uncharacterized protein LOC116198899 [Punica granatum]PKI78426.1 hypothetical protein CRG98_001172 [Punica granatum]
MLHLVPNCHTIVLSGRASACSSGLGRAGGGFCSEREFNSYADRYSGRFFRRLGIGDRASDLLHSRYSSTSSPLKGERLELECLVGAYGWEVRRLDERDEDEMRQVARIQAEAFHEPTALFDDLFFQFFQAEVLSGLLYKLRNSPPDRYACLVAEPATEEQPNELVGVVDVTVLRDDSVLQHLPGEEEYLYVSGIAVSQSFRRQKVATALLEACAALSSRWGFRYLALRAYEDDLGARKLYSNAGYEVVGADPVWVTLIGRKRRVLMIKKI